MSTSFYAIDVEESLKPYYTKMLLLLFITPIYYGAAIMATIDDNFVNSLTGKLVQVNAKCSFTVNAGANQYIWFARPATNNPTF